MTTPTLDAATPVGAALQEVRAATARFVDVVRQGGLDHHDTAGLLGIPDEVEAARNQLLAADVELIAAPRCRGAGAGMPTLHGEGPGTTIPIGPHEASRRVRAAEAVGSRRSMTGSPLPRVRPVIAEAMAA